MLYLLIELVQQDFNSWASLLNIFVLRIEKKVFFLNININDQQKRQILEYIYV